MAVNDATLATLRTSPQFVGRVRIAILNYAVFLDNSNAGGAFRNWSNQILNSPAAVEQWVALLIPYALINVAQGSTATGTGDTLDIAATDAALRGQIETQIQGRKGVL